MENKELLDAMNNELNKVKKAYKTAVLYIRYSTANQHDESAEAQIRACEEYAKANNIKIIYVYKDLGISGTSTKGRSEFNQMIHDSSKRLFDLVLVHKIDRFARSTEDYFTNEKKLNKNGVEVIAVDSPFDNSPAGKLLKTMMVGMAEMFSSNLSNEVSYKNREYARKGRYLGGFPPLGYKSIKVTDENGKEYKTVQIDESEAKIIRLIYKMYVNLFSGKSIANELYELGYKTRNGNAFTRKTIIDIIDNEIYKGTYVFSKKSKSKLEPIKIEDNHEAIIDKELWNKAHAIRKANISNTKPKKKSENKYLLTGIIYCKQCGYAFTGVGGSKQTRYYGCISCRQKHQGFCFNSKYVNKNKLEDKIFDLIYDKLFTSETIESYTKKIMDNLKNTNDDVNRLKELEKEKKSLREETKQLAKLYTSKKVSMDILDEMQQELNKRTAIVDKRIYELSVSVQPISENIIKSYLLNIKKNLHKLNGDEKESFIKNIIDRIEVDINKIDIYFNIYNPYPTDGGTNLPSVSYKGTTPLGVVPLYNTSMSIIKKENGTYIGNISISKQL